eukprot:gene3143-3420_t
MAELARMLRLQILGVRAKEPRRYYLSFQVLAAGASAAALLPYSTTADEADQAAVEALRPDEVCRTETSSFNCYPEFANGAFVLRLPCGLERCASGGTRIAVSLFAAPSLDEPAGPIVAGREVDQLVASAALEFTPGVVSRLLAGDSSRVSLQLQPSERKSKVQLMAGGLGGKAVQLHNLRGSAVSEGPAGSNSVSNIYGSTETQVLLELMMLDVGVPMAAGSLAARQYVQSNASPAIFAPGATGTSGSTAHSRGRGHAVGPGAASSSMVVLSVLVSAASNLPLVPGPAGELTAPSAFVALKSGADATSRRPAQAVTRAAASGQHPSWGQLLHVSYPDAELSREQLLISIVNDSTSRVLVKGSLPLTGLIPGYPYSLAVALSEVCMLYVTVVLGLGAKTQLDALQGAGIAASGLADQIRLLQLRVANSSIPLSSLVPGSAPNEGQLWAVWRAQPGPTAPQSSRSLQLYAPLEGREGGEGAASAAIRGVNGGVGLMSPAVVGGSADGSGADAQGHEVVAALPLMMLTRARESVGAEDAEVMQLWPPDQMVLLPFWPKSPVAMTLEVHLQLLPTDANAHGTGKRLLLDSSCLAGLSLSCDALLSQRSGKSYLLKDQLLKPSAALSADAAGRLTIEAVAWDMMSYLDHLKKLGADVEGAAGGQPASVYVDPATTAALQQPSSLTSAAVEVNMRAVSKVLDTVVGDLLMKQQAKERARNAELVHRLQQLHSEHVDVLALQRQYSELQDAHYQQSQLLTAQEANTATAAAMKKALSDQEAVIARLEKLLAAAAARAKELECWKSTADALQEEVTRLRQELSRLAAARPADEMAALATQAAHAQADKEAAAAALAERDKTAATTAAEYEAALTVKESDRLAAVMRVEKAEAAAIAAQNELLDVTKRYAREIAQLKTKLAEKDAQLLGGFGSLTSLYLGELGPMPAGHPTGLGAASVYASNGSSWAIGFRLQ